MAITKNKIKRTAIGAVKSAPVKSRALALLMTLAMLIMMATALSACNPPTPDPTPEPVGVGQTITFDTSNAAIKVGESIVESAQTDENGNLTFTAMPVDNAMTLLWHEAKPSLNITVNGNVFTITGATADATVSLIYWPKTPSPTPVFTGTGSANDSYVITDEGDLQQLAADVFDGNPYTGDHFSLAADLDLSGFEWLPIGGGAGVTSFQGVFDGKNQADGSNHTITGINYNHTEGDWSKGTSMKNNIGLFGKVEVDASVSNLTIINGSIAAQRAVGGIVGTSWGTIDNCVNLSVTVRSTDSQGTGGIAGASRINGDLTPPSTPVISNCRNEAAVTSTLAANPNSSSNGGGGNSQGGSAGGIVGENEGKVYNCSNTGTIKAEWNAGGLVGSDQDNSQQESNTVTLGLIANSYNAGNVEGYYAGGIVGFQFASAENVYNYGTVTVVATPAGGAAGEIIGEFAPDPNTQGIVNDYLYYRTGTGALPVAGQVTSGSFNGSESGGNFGYDPATGKTSLLTLLNAWVDETTLTDPYQYWAIVVGENNGYPIFDY
jgi:hypothetical protein